MLLGHLRKFNFEQFQKVRIYLITIHQSLNKTHLITRRVVSPAMMLIRTCAGGGGGGGGVLWHAPAEKKRYKWCGLVHSECPKVCYYQPKDQQPKFCAIFLSTINPDTHVGTKINTFTFNKRGLGAAAPPPPPPKAKKIDSPEMMWIQIRARGWMRLSPGFFFIKMVLPGAF